MDPYFWTKYLHVIGATIIFGTGIGTAFQMLMAHWRGDPKGIALVSRNVVIADWVFTTPAVIAQPITGFALIYLVGYSLGEGWIVLTLILYVFTGLCWLPVVWIQIRLRELAEQAVAAGEPLPPAYYRLFRWWFILGWPAFGAILVIFHLMIQRPVIW